MAGKSKKNKGEPRPKGRPPRKYVERGKKAVQSAWDAIVHRLSPSPEAPETTVTTSGGTLLTGDAARITLLASQSFCSRSERRQPNNLPVFLDSIKMSTRRSMGSIPTEECPQWFDKQSQCPLRLTAQRLCHKRASFSQAVDIKWFGHPGDSEHDIRARKFIVRWSHYLANPDIDLRKQAVEKGKVVLRWKYHCSGLHDLDFGGQDKTESPSRSPTPTPSSHGSHISMNDQDERGRWNRCGGGVKLYFEVTADNLTHIKIWQVGEHDDTPSHYPFAFSRHLRLLILESMRRYGAKATTINRDLVSQFQRHDSGGHEEALPSHRFPTLKQIRQMLPAVRNRGRLDRNPFRATHLMVHRNPENMYCYTRHDFSKPDADSQFTIGITDQFSLDSTILNTAGPEGIIFMDSTHRLQNENRAATTVFCTANAERHMMPDKSGIQHRNPAEQEKIYARCQSIVEHGFSLDGFMIDKSRSELNALKRVLKELGLNDAYIRLCQFHIIQAILNWDCDNGKRGIGFTLSHDLKFEICVLFQTLQRCRTWDAWPETKATFYKGLEALLSGLVEESSDDGSSDGHPQTDNMPENFSKKKKPLPKPRTKEAKVSGLTCYEAVRAYFDKNWFTDVWIPHFTDIGMPSEQSRDGPWNTNNWAETVFKMFNAIFLDWKHNKRIDRLASIILNDFLPYFRYFETPTRPEPRQMLETSLDAHSLWESDLVQAVTTAEAAQAYTVSRTGKTCVDILAARLARSNGPIADWLKAEAATEHKKPEDTDDKARRMRGDATAEVELHTVLERLANHRVESEIDPVTQIDFGDYRGIWFNSVFSHFQLKKKITKVHGSAGRPKKMHPLHPWRKHYHPRKHPVAGSYSPRFIKKRGPPKMRRLARNSLFPATRQLKDARRRAQIQRIGKARRNTQSRVRLRAVVRFNTPSHDQDEFLNPEDLSLGVWSFRRWLAPEYELRMDEMEVFVTCFNQSTFADQTGILFLYGSPHMPYSQVLRALDWTQPLSIETRLEPTTTSTNWCFSSFTIAIGRSFITPSTAWTAGCPRFRWFNSLAPSSVPPQDIQTQLVVQQYLTHPRNENPCRPAQPPPIPSQNYAAIYLNLQHDPYTCGFWAVYVGFALLLGFNPDNAVAHDLDGPAIKELTGSVYASFIGDVIGVPITLMQNLFGQFQPVVFAIDTDSDAIMSRRPANMDRASLSDPPSSKAAPATSEGSSHQRYNAAPVLASNFLELVLAPYNLRQQWVIGNTIVSAAHLQSLISGDVVSDGVIDGFFFLYVNDWLKRSPRQPSNAKSGPRNRWFNKVQFNVFEKETLIIPIFWRKLQNMGRPWGEACALDTPTFLHPDYYTPMILDKVDFCFKSLPHRTVHTYHGDKQIWSITPPATNSQGRRFIPDSAEVSVILGEERRHMLFSYIVKHTQKVAIGPLEYCGNTHRISMGRSTRAVPCYGDPSLPEFYAECDLKSRLLPTAIPGERRPTLSSAATKTLKSQLREVASSRALKRAHEGEEKENMDAPPKVKRSRMSADQRLALGMAC
ncbi:hypothetical protein B0H14DRAFT_3726674 [Mycena olivaceomarginata]|nr:hypothetical protein B0H14DRAFT_3726674 [Mycena olivaceomarginata]